MTGGRSFQHLARFWPANLAYDYAVWTIAQALKDMAL